jgi:hypothetical protein
MPNKVTSKETEWSSVPHLPGYEGRLNQDGYRETRQTEVNPEAKLCYICQKPTDDLAGDPGLWPLALPFKDGNGKKRPYHVECVVRALEKVCP